jgi:flavin reductase (DIM6/NTAB) family NADH-FMN oxidoreductase RutF
MNTDINTPIKSMNPDDMNGPALHHLLLSAIAPRPIAFASTINKKGEINLSPFSFFNAFGINPTTLIFSPSRRGRDNTVKHTYENIKEVPEVVINVVNYDIVEQVSLASAEYPRGINEFKKAGLSEAPSIKIKPPRVLESPVQFECRVRDVIETGDQGGAANLVICEIVHIHVHEDVLDKKGQIDNEKIRLVGRLGGPLYCHTTGDAAFSIQKPIGKNCIGIDSLPEHIRFSKELNGNDLGKMGNLEHLPSAQEIEAFGTAHPEVNTRNYFTYARQALAKGKAFEALVCFLAFG